MRIVGRRYGKAARGNGFSSIIKNTMAVGTTIPTWSYGKTRTCEHAVDVAGCSKPARRDAPRVGQGAHGNERRYSATKGVIANRRAVGTTVFPAMADPGEECNAQTVITHCSEPNRRNAPEVGQGAHGTERRYTATKGVIANRRAVGTTVFPVAADGRLTCDSYVNAHLR